MVSLKIVQKGISQLKFNSLILIAALLYCHFSLGHSRFKSNEFITPRTTSDGVKTGPCGGVVRSSVAKPYAPGTQITVEWEETINHPGHFEFYFSEANDTGFKLLLTVSDVMDSSNDLPHNYSVTIKLPDVLCDKCTLQMIQVMTDRSPPTNYYSCADIKLTSTAAPPPPLKTPTVNCDKK